MSELLQGRSEKAVEVLRRAIAIRGDFSGAYVNLAKVYQAQGKNGEEVEIWRKYAERFGSADKYSAYARDRLFDLTERTAASE